VDPGTRALLPGSFDPEEAITLTLEPGSALIIGPYTIHGSGRNESNGPRRAFLNGFASPGANRRIYPGCGTGRRIVVC
jgi:ectoine hydroxylase-related dioxygenase (phytanoyl-CoA dioxygenase family)